MVKLPLTYNLSILPTQHLRCPKIVPHFLSARNGTDPGYATLTFISRFNSVLFSSDTWCQTDVLQTVCVLQHGRSSCAVGNWQLLFGYKTRRHCSHWGTETRTGRSWISHPCFGTV